VRFRRSRRSVQRGRSTLAAIAEEQGPEAAADWARDLSAAGETISEVITALDRVRETLRAGPSTAAIGRVEAKLLAKLADETVQLQTEAKELSARLSAVRRRIESTAGPSAHPSTPPKPREREGPGGPTPPPPEAASEGMRLLVIRMASMGSSRLDIEEHLRDDLGITSARALVDHILDGEVR
jgi:hypothetical protein